MSCCDACSRSLQLHPNQTNHGGDISQSEGWQTPAVGFTWVRVRRAIGNTCGQLSATGQLRVRGRKRKVAGTEDVIDRAHQPIRDAPYLRHSKTASSDFLLPRLLYHRNDLRHETTSHQLPHQSVRGCLCSCGYGSPIMLARSCLRSARTFTNGAVTISKVRR